MKKKIEINIQPVPPLPSEVIEAKKNHTLVLFIGAGVSRIDGCESWDSLSHRLLDKCYSQEIINYKEYKRLELYGAKELLTIVKGVRYMVVILMKIWWLMQRKTHHYLPVQL